MSSIEQHCIHDNTIDDHRTADTICLSCGVIIDERLSFHLPYQEKDSFVSEELYTEDKYHQYLQDFCFNAGLPLNLALDAYNLYKKNHKELKLTRITNNTKSLLFSAMFVTLHNKGSSFSLSEMLPHCEADFKTLSRLTRVYFDKHLEEETYPSASDLIGRLCANLQINRKESMNIQRSVNRFEKLVSVGLNPSTISTAFVYHYACKKKMKLTLNEVCEMAGTSSISVKRFLRRYKIEMIC